jgi:hypothetical protein
MDKPRISWYVLEDIDGQFEFIPKKSHDEEESYSPGDTMKVKIQVWNNRGGDEDVSDANNARLITFFKNYEDNFLLRLCKVKQGDNEAQDIQIDIDRGVFNIGTLSGRGNNGSILNRENYNEIELQFGPIPTNIRSELKSLVLDIEYDN